MKLTKVWVDHFRNYLTSDPIDIEGDVTCLVGKNESGKSAFLTALYRLNPDDPNRRFDVSADYPAWLEKEHRLDGKLLEEHAPIRAEFALEDEDIAATKAAFGHQLVTEPKFTYARLYNDETRIGLTIDEKAAVKACLGKANLTGEAHKRAKAAKTIAELRDIAVQMTGSDNESEKSAGSILS